jgi:kinetochore protein NNF1
MSPPPFRPHTLPPERLYLAHLAPYLTETEKELQAELERTQTENETLALEVQRQRHEVEHLMAGLESVIKDVESANGVMDEVIEGEDLGKETREMEEEIRTAAGRGAKL